MREEQPDANLIAFSDIINIFKKGKVKIIIGSLALASFAAYYTLTKPIKFQAEATFKERTSSNQGIGQSSIALSLFSGSNSGDKNGAITIMKSRKLLEPMIGNLGLQATLSKKSSGSSTFQTIRENLTVEYSYFKKSPIPPLPDLKPTLKAKNIVYNGEIPLSATLTFESEDAYRVTGPKNEDLGLGKIDHPFVTEEFQFMITRQNSEPVTSDVYFISLKPLSATATGISKQIDLKYDKEDPNLLILRYSNRDRHFSSQLINKLMGVYQDFLKGEQNRASDSQIDYLNRRETEMGNNLRTMLNSHADNISSEVTSAGYTDSQKAMAFYAGQLQRYQERLLRIDLELNRRERFKEAEVTFDSIPDNSPEAPNIINRLVSQLQQLKVESDALDLVLRNPPSTTKKHTEEALSAQINTLKTIKQNMTDAKAILASLERGNVDFPMNVDLVDDPKFMIHAWRDQLTDQKANTEESNQVRSEFKSYLSNLIHYFEVSEKATKERLKHQQSPQTEFQGINIQMANSIYLTYCNELNEVESKIVQYNHIGEQLKDPDFEISSLNSFLNEPVINAMVNKASVMLMALQDESNRSVKEKERIKKELDLQKRFLGLHIKQSVQLLNLKQMLVQDKIFSLQNAKMELIQKKISILEKQFSDSIESHISNLKQEKQLIEHQQKGVRKEMATLPQKWVSEKLINQQLSLNSLMVEELTHLVESKNIASNLAIIQSAPIDPAVPPTHPVRPKLFLFTILGAIFGAILTMGLLITEVMLKGIVASRENLELRGLHISDSLRRLTTYLHHPTSTSEDGKTLIMINCSKEAAEETAVLFSRKREKSVILDLTFMQGAGDGLLKYLEGEAPVPTILKSDRYDTIPSGGECSYKHELISSKAFDALLLKLKKEYQWVIAITDVEPSSPDAEYLLNTFDHALINAQGETLQELKLPIRAAQDSDNPKKISFLI